jgi:integrase
VPLFPGENGDERSSGFGVQIGNIIAQEIGVTMTPHQFRHLAAKLYLDRRPGDYETVRRLLGHKDIATTMRFYRELDTVLAVKRYGDLVTHLILELETRTTPKRPSGRRHQKDDDV